MSGHSKWATIKHKKAKEDVKRGKLFSKLIKEITVAVRIGGGGDVETNPKLRIAIERAKDANMPMDTIRRAIERALGAAGGTDLEELFYEGYGPGGVAFFIEAVTDNKKRTSAELRKIFSKYGGSLGESGCVSWMFEKKGYITVDKSKVSEEELFEIAIEAGCEDFKSESQDYEIITKPQDFERVKKALEERNIEIKIANLTYFANNYMQVDVKTAKQLLALSNELADDEDIKEVYTNFEIPDELMAQLTTES